MIVSCSWDDGTEDENVLRVFRRLKLKATFFPSVWSPISRSLYEGFEVGNHTQWHISATNQTLSDFKRDVIGMEKVLFKRLGVTPKGLAFPYGHMNEELHQLVLSLGYAYTRGVSYKSKSFRLITPHEQYGSRSFWNTYSLANNCFTFIGHSKDVNPNQLSKDLERMIEDGCEFITHLELMRMINMI